MEGLCELTPFGVFTMHVGVMQTHREYAKRAMFHPPPARFMIEFLPISNKGSHNHGMRITPHNSDDESIITPCRDLEYDIWRKWEDILWFQQDLESAYSRGAREKKVRLAQGKGVKSLNGFYKQDMASSFESLPPGPLPSSVAQDLHQYIPRLSKKGTFFRASQSTLEQRQKEFRAFVEALFAEDVPSLIRELRETHTVTDFFGLWRRDYDCLEKSQRSSHSSVASSVHSSYFARSTPTINSTKSSSSSPSRRRSSRRPPSIGSLKSSYTFSLTSFESPRQSTLSMRSESIRRLSGSSDDVSIKDRPRALSNTDSDTSSTHSDEAYPEVGSAPAVVGESPLAFHHNPVLHGERPSLLEALPEERELVVDSPESYFECPQKCKAGSPIPDQIADQDATNAWRRLGTPATKATVDEAPNSVREPLPLDEETFLGGMSVTDSLNAAVLPREDTTPLSTLDESVPISQFDTDSDSDESEDEGCSTSNARGIPFPTMGSGGCPTRQLRVSIPTTPTICSPISRDSGSSFIMPSPTHSDFSMATPLSSFSSFGTSTITGAPLSIKAAHNSTIIMLRVQRDMSFPDIRQRLYDKFVGQEGVPLSKEFAVAMVVSSSPVSPGTTDGQLRPLSSSGTDTLELHFIDTQDDWQQVVLVRDTNKVMLRILDTERS